MATFSHRAKKSLGQNFLTSQSAKRLIVETADIKSRDIILEIGPGKGALTELILEKVLLDGGKFIAVEKDDSLFTFLSEKFNDQINKGVFTLIHGDILDTHVQENIFSLLGNKTYKIIANIPYYITGEIIRTFLTSSKQPSDMVLLVQKEVAERITARSRGKDIGESILSLSVKAYGNVTYIDTVKAKYFSPQPKVDSAIIFISNISRKFFENNSAERNSVQEQEDKFFAIVKAGFAHKRKKLVGNLVEKGHMKEKIVAALISQKISIDVRAEELKITDWKNLIESI